MIWGGVRGPSHFEEMLRGDGLSKYEKRQNRRWIQEYWSWKRGEFQAMYDLFMPDFEQIKHEEIQIIPGHPKKVIWVAINLPQELKQRLADYLTKNKVVFT